MKVGELMRDSRFTPGAGRESAAPPRVSYILPTFRRGDNGMLQRALDSVLAQSFSDLEIIVIDDGSTDSTAEVISSTMLRDPRVSVLRHDRNIGLPAISGYEGYRLARGEFIGFTFDDNVLHPDALQSLIDEADGHPGSMVAGYATMFTRESDGGIRRDYLGKDSVESGLLLFNMIPNGAVIVPKSILEVVGFYDPHITLTRLCDYDLWKRIRRHFPIRLIDMNMVEEYGMATDDSLGKTYPLESWVSDDRMRQVRDRIFRPEHYEDIDVFETWTFESRRTRARVEEFVAAHIAARPWMRPPEPPAAPPGRVPRIIVVAHPVDVSVQLVFEGLRDIPGVHVRMLERDHHPVVELAEADALIVARDLIGADEWVSVARELGLPVFLYLDENLPLMAARSELDVVQTARFAIETLGPAMRRIAGVLTSSEALAESLRGQGLHDEVTALPLTVPDVVEHEWPTRGPEQDPLFTVALFVGPHRLHRLKSVIIPALAEAADASGRRVRLLVPESAGNVPNRTPDGVELGTFPISSDYFVALRDLRDLRPDVVAVPPGPPSNAPFESLHPLLSAAAIGSGVIVPDSGPYQALRDTDGVTMLDAAGSREAWVAAFQQALTRADRYVSRAVLASFPPSAAADQLLRAVQPHIPTEDPDVLVRLRDLSDWLAYQLAVRRGRPMSSVLMVDPPSGRSHRDRGLRRLHALTRRRGALARFPAEIVPEEYQADAFSGWERLELSPPLSAVPYLSYPVVLEEGPYRRLRALIWGGSSEPGGLIGIELVDPSGAIRLHEVASLPSVDTPIDLEFDAQSLVIDEAGTYELRVFARNARTAHLLERVDRGVRRIDRPRARPMVVFEP